MATKYSAKFIDKHRYDYVDHDWWEYAYEHFVEDLDGVGISVEHHSEHNITFDLRVGARFAGRIYGTDFGKFMKAHQLHESYPLLMKANERFKSPSMAWGGPRDALTLQPFGFESVFERELEDEFQAGVLEALGWKQKYEQELDNLEADVALAIEEHCHDLLQTLKEEYDYLTSDEHIIDALEANDIMEEVDDEAA